MQGVSKRRLQTKACIAGAKTFLMLFNIVFWVIGLIVLISGLWMKMSITKVFALTTFGHHFGLPTLVLLIGASMIVISFLACGFVSRERPLLLYSLAAAFFVVFALVFGASISGYAYRNELKLSLKDSLNQSLREYGSGGVLDRDWDRVQQYLKCCGVDDYRDWSLSGWAGRHPNLTYPDSCCRAAKTCDNVNVELIYESGCYETILVLLSDNLGSIGLGMLLVAVFQLIGVALACCLAVNINKALYEQMQ